MDTRTCAGRTVWLRTGASDGHEPSGFLDCQTYNLAYHKELCSLEMGACGCESWSVT